MFNLFNNFNINTYFKLEGKGLYRFKDLEITLGGIKLYVYDKKDNECIEINNIDYIVSINEPYCLTLCDRFLNFLKNDIETSPLLLKFILALWNENYNDLEICVQEDKNIIFQFLDYVHNISKQQEYIELIVMIFTNYMQFKNKLN